MKSRTRRFLAQGWLVASVYAGYKWVQLQGRIGRDTTGALHRQHQRSAEAIYELATRLEGLPIKVCQFLGSRADVVPGPYVSVLSRLQDQVPARPFSTIAPFVEAELGQPLDAVFSEFDQRPVAAASLAQVHRARLHDGREVAVKVQYPEIREVIESDLANFEFFIRILSRLERDFDFGVVIREVQKYVPLELDFYHEAENARRMKENLAGREDVFVPEVIDRWSTGRILLSDYSPGVRVTDVDGLRAAGVQPQEMADRLIAVFSEMVLQHGFFHADPHPGNLLVRDDGCLILLDFGLAKEFAPGFREGLGRMVLAIMTGEREQIGTTFRELGFRTRREDDHSLAILAETFLGWALRNRKSYAEPEMLARFNEELPEALKDNPLIDVPSDILLIARVSGLLSGIGKQLDSHVDIGAAIMPYLVAVPAATA